MVKEDIKEEDNNIDKDMIIKEEDSGKEDD